jgi:signal peptidase I
MKKLSMPSLFTRPLSPVPCPLSLVPFPSLTTSALRRSLPLVLGVVTLLLAFQFVDLVRVTGHSMKPTLQTGQWLLRLKRPASYQHGEIVVFRPPQEHQTRASSFVKRLVALPGDTVSIQNDQVVLNGQVLNEAYVAETSSRAENFPEVVLKNGEVVAFEGFALAELPDYLQATLALLEPLPHQVLEQSYRENVAYVGTIRLSEGFFFVLGDNRGFSASEDSRLFGAIQAKAIQGKIHTF